MRLLGILAVVVMNCAVAVGQITVRRVFNVRDLFPVIEERDDTEARRNRAEPRLTRIIKQLLVIDHVVRCPDPISGHIDAGTIRLQPRRIVRGAVVDPSGQPMIGVAVALAGPNATRKLAMPSDMTDVRRGYLARRESKTDSLGWFFFGDLAAGTYKLSVGKRDQAPEQVDLVVSEDQDPPMVRIER